MTLNMLIAGFGGQGVLFMGKVAAYTAMVDDRCVSWLPSYDKFVNTVQPGGQIFIDSALIDAKCPRTDIKAHYIPCTQMSKDEGLSGLANIIMLGKVLRETRFTSFESLCEAMRKCIPPKKAHLTDANLKALKLGYDYAD